ncbi:thioredoxin domain-containing protein, partial [bacterium]|nr:thioredoxin domain-containing protein [bacterium]
ISILGLFSFLISICLAVKSVFIIKKLCVLCLFTYFLNLFIGLLGYEKTEKNLLVQLKEFFLDIFEGIKKYPITTVILTTIAVCFLTYTSTSYVFTPNVKKSKSIMKFADMKTNPYKISGNILGDKDGKVTVELYSDFVCPICYVYNLMIHKAMLDVKNIKIEHHNFPLDKECNKYIRVQMHSGACRMARYGIAAENQGKYWDMATELFENHPKTDDEAIEIAKKLNLDIKKFKNDMNSKETNEKLLTDIDKARNTYALNGTPAIAINKKLYLGIKPYYELKELLIESGGYAK